MEKIINAASRSNKESLPVCTDHHQVFLTCSTHPTPEIQHSPTIHITKWFKTHKTIIILHKLNSTPLPAMTALLSQWLPQTMATSRKISPHRSQNQFHFIKWRHGSHNQHHKCFLVQGHQRNLWSRTPSLPHFLWHASTAQSTTLSHSFPPHSCLCI